MAAIIAHVPLPSDMFLPSFNEKGGHFPPLPPSDITSATRRMLSTPPTPPSSPVRTHAHPPTTTLSHASPHGPRPRPHSHHSDPLILSTSARHPSLLADPHPLTDRRTLSLPIIHESALLARAEPSRRRRFPVTRDSSLLLLKVATANSAKLRPSGADAGLGEGLPVLDDGDGYFGTGISPAALTEAMLAELASVTPLPRSQPPVTPLVAIDIADGASPDTPSRLSRFGSSGRLARRFGGAVKRSWSLASLVPKSESLRSMRRQHDGLP